MFMPSVRKSDAAGSIPGRRPTWRGLILLLLTVFLTFAIYSLFIHPSLVQQEISEAQLLGLVKAGRVKSIINEPDPSTGICFLTGTFISAPKAASAAPVAIQDIPDTASGAFKVPVDLQLAPYLASQIEQAGYKGIIETQNNTNIIRPLLLNLLPVTLFGCWVLFVCVCLTRILYKAAFAPRGT